MKKYEELVNFIVENVGGKNNILDVTHCVTRLRFKLKDEKIAKDDVLKSNDGIITIMHTAGQYQVVIGNHVPEVYAQLVSKLNLKPGANTTKEKMGFKEKALDLISGIFFPSLSVLCACGMIKGINTILSFAGLYTMESDIFTLINAIGDSFFYFFPIVIGYNTAKKINMNPFTGMIIGAALCYPSINDVDMNLFGLDLNVSYVSTVLPVIITCFVAAPIEKLCNRILPDVIKSFMTPTIVLMISVILGYMFIGPVVNGFSNIVSSTLLNICAISPALAGLIFGALWLVFVVMGIHIRFVVLCIINLSQGIPDPLIAASVFSAFVVAAIVFAVFIKTKDIKLKGACLSAGISGMFGITEPALYGILISRPVMFGIACLVSGIAGGIGGFFGLQYYQMAGLGIFEIPALLPATGTGTVLIQAIGVSVVSFVVAFILAFMFYKEKEEETSVDIELRNEEIYAPVSGKVVPLSEVKDDAFATGALGKGCVIQPSDGKVYAPFDGTVLVMFPTGHAVGMINEDGCEVLIHIGINTVELEGKHFIKHVKVGDRVSKGQLLVEFDQKAIEKEGYATDIIVVVSNTKDYKNIVLKNTGSVETGSPILLAEC